MAQRWTRLVRFKAHGHGDRIFLGQPVDPSIDVGLALHSGQPVDVYQISGTSALDNSAVVTTNKLQIAKLLTPLSQEETPLVRCLGLNYLDHAEEVAHLAGREKADLPRFPILFYKPSTTLIAGGEPIILPEIVKPYEEHLPDYEVELAIVIGKAAKNVSEEHALDYVLGYTGANDVSFRQWQQVIPQWGFSKSFDDTNPLGPVLVSASALSNPQDVPLKTTLNGNVVQNGNTSKQIFNVKKTIASLSQSTTLQPGTLILTGTPAGVGFVRREKLWLKPGDEVHCSVGAGIGTLINSVQAEPQKARL
ncbi:hypothetical protein M408DRAFT_334300 [Serendipita vermifera MAFF 305830]|uniref:Fumarylacetoacetase-like C-terminal domain-containing protein n=1 Tax=Serendipita vermifera MAFF 305830 TaxID=933852 RepID=A0A0C3AK95_SERVB|nr:hypothetical protein M408DRAFT_334300 [Serendipita vermifera MAFF 305830]